MARESNFGSLMVLALILALLAIGLWMVLFSPNGHALDRHGADASWATGIVDSFPESTNCYEHRTEDRRLFAFLFQNDDCQERAALVFTTKDGSFVTSFISKIEYFLGLTEEGGPYVVQ